MGKLLSIIVAAIGVIGAVAFIVIDIVAPFVNIYICCAVALAVVLILAMCSILISMLSRIHGELSRLVRNHSNKED